MDELIKLSTLVSKHPKIAPFLSRIGICQLKLDGGYSSFTFLRLYLDDSPTDVTCFAGDNCDELKQRIAKDCPKAANEVVGLTPIQQTPQQAISTVQRNEVKSSGNKSVPAKAAGPQASPE